jgi:hypothetical protein
MEAGEIVTWESQSMGVYKVKNGKALAIIPAGQSLGPFIPSTAKKSHVKACNDISKVDRVLVEVLAGKDGSIKHYYTPTVAMVERRLHGICKSESYKSGR